MAYYEVIRRLGASGAIQRHPESWDVIGAFEGPLSAGLLAEVAAPEGLSFIWASDSCRCRHHPSFLLHERAALNNTNASIRSADEIRRRRQRNARENSPHMYEERICEGVRAVLGLTLSAHPRPIFQPPA